MVMVFTLCFEYSDVLARDHPQYKSNTNSYLVLARYTLDISSVDFGKE